ncbi:MAG: antibiotic biosynthesis monooxygenase [Marinobacter sp.]|nr:antibiotic biosynthesis monooxygenase [Marinobacter sp.]
MKSCKISAPQKAQTVLVSRKVRQGFEKEFEDLSNQLTQRAARFPGYLGAALFRPSSCIDPEYQIVFKFKSPETLMAWEISEQRTELLKNIEALLVTTSKKETLSGIANWATSPEQGSQKPPAKWKMTVIGWLALYPAVTLISILFGDSLTQMPLLIRTMIVTLIVMVLMSYVMMPFMKKLFHGWLFPITTQNHETASKYKN